VRSTVDDHVDAGGEELEEVLGPQQQIAVIGCAKDRAADQQDGERVDVGRDRDSSEAAFGGEVGRDHPGDLDRDWDSGRVVSRRRASKPRREQIRLMMRTAVGFRAFAGITTTRAFTGPERLRFDWQRSYTTDQWVDQVPTFGGHSTLPPQKLDQLMSGIRTAVDDAGGRFTMRYAALAVIAHRRDDSVARNPLATAEVAEGCLDCGAR
jgi:hypothetical protein